jgi:hypothetical protein
MHLATTVNVLYSAPAGFRKLSHANILTKKKEYFEEPARREYAVSQALPDIDDPVPLVLVSRASKVTSTYKIPTANP